MLDDNRLAQMRAYNKIYYAKNRKRLVDNRRAKYWAEHDEHKEALKQSYYRNRDRALEYMKEYRQTPNYKARMRVYYAVITGRLKKLPCEKCGEAKVFAHHHKGYDEKHWLDVQWLCNKHHGEAHRVG